jgi:hypothetical protein
VSVSLSQNAPLDRVDKPGARASRRLGQPRLPFVVGAAASIVVLILRYAGVLVEPVAVAVVVLCFVFSPGPRRVSERYLLLFALGFGWLPLLGWVPGIGTEVDVPGIVLAITIGVTCGHQVHLGRTRARTVALPTYSELVAVILGIAVTLWWTLPFARLSLSGRLAWLFAGWDNNSHFSIFQANLQLGSFIHVRPHLPGGGDRLGYDYPQGMHQAWAQAVRLWVPHPPMTIPWLLNAYSVMLLLTTGSIVILGCMAIARLCRRDLFAALPAMAIIVTLFGIGRFAPFNGFPNYELAVAAAAVGVSLLVRPSLRPHLNLFVVAGMGLIVVYNWYPLIILVAPAVAVAAIRARSTSSGRDRLVTTAAIVATAIAIAMPAAVFLHRGTSTLYELGGGIVPPWGLLMVCLAALIGVAIFRQATHPDRTTNLIIAAPAVLGASAITFLAAFEDHATGSVSYYGQKFAAGVFAIDLIVLVCVLAGEVASSRFRLRLSMPMAFTATALLSVAALQIDGYVGPYSWSKVINGPGSPSSIDAKGLVLHHHLDRARLRSPEAESVLTAAQTARTSGAGQWWYVDPQGAKRNGAFTNFAEFDEWFIDLLGDPSNAAYYGVVPLAPTLDFLHTPHVYAQFIIKHFPNPENGRIHLFVPNWLRGVIVRQDPEWGRPGALLQIQTP